MPNRLLEETLRIKRSSRSIPTQPLEVHSMEAELEHSTLDKSAKIILSLTVLPTHDILGSHARKPKEVPLESVLWRIPTNMRVPAGRKVVH